MAEDLTERHRLPGIQGLRAIAILLVVGYHAGLPIGAGYIGVDVFFVISGFVITRMVLRQSEASGRIDFRRFWSGRIRRLMPALALMVLLAVLLAVPFGSPVGVQPDTSKTAIGAIFWVSNAMLALLTLGYFAPTAEDNPLLHTWSLAVEEQFYIFFPILVAFGLLIARKRRATAATSVGVLLTIVAIPSLLLCIALTYVELPIPIGGALAFYSPMTRAWEFAAGALVAVALQKGWRPRRSTAAVSGWAGLAILGIGLVVIRDAGIFPGYVALLPVVGTTLIVIATQRSRGITPALSTRPMTWIGDVSYGWYLYHWPALVFVGSFWEAGDAPVVVDLVTCAAALGLAALSFRWVEEPIRHRRFLGEMRTWRLAALLLAPVLVASVALSVGASRGWGDPEVQAMREQLDHGQWKYQKVCQSPVRVDLRDMDECRFPGESGDLPVILMGDSNAGVYADALVAAGRELDRTVTVATVPSCPLVDVEQVRTGRRTWIDCARFYEASMDWLSEQQPSLVLVAAGAGAVDTDSFELKLPDGSIAKSRADKEAAWQAALVRTFDRIRGLGSVPVQIGVIPRFVHDEADRLWSPRECRLVDALVDIEDCAATLSRAEADDDQASALAAEDAATVSSDVMLLRLRDRLCPEQTCATYRDGTWRYEDGGHLAYGEAMSLEPVFIDLLDQLRTLREARRGHPLPE